MKTEAIYTAINDYLTHKNENELHKLLDDLREDMRNQANKTAGKSNIAKAMKAVIKRAKKLSNISLHGAIMINDLPYVCDGNMIIVSYQAVDLELAPDVPKPDLIKLVDDAKYRVDKELTLPDVGTLKQSIIDQPKSKKEYDFGEGMPLVDATYLLDILMALPDAKCSYSSPIAPLHFESVYGEAILLPIRRG